VQAMIREAEGHGEGRARRADRAALDLARLRNEAFLSARRASRPRPVPVTRLNQVWAYDFVFDACANGHQLKCLTIIDEWSRECLGIADEFKASAAQRVLEGGKAIPPVARDLDLTRRRFGDGWSKPGA